MRGTHFRRVVRQKCLAIHRAVPPAARAYRIAEPVLQLPGLVVVDPRLGACGAWRNNARSASCHPEPHVRLVGDIRRRQLVIRRRRGPVVNQSGHRIDAIALRRQRAEERRLFE